jgi:predicted nucleic acid-binding protein
MSRFILDSSVFIDVTREQRDGPGPATAFLRRAAREGELWSVTPIRTEVRWGMRADEAPALTQLLDSVFWLDVTTELADRAGSFGHRFGRSHGLNVVDAILAAAAEFLSADLATRNVRDFPMFPDLRPPYSVTPGCGKARIDVARNGLGGPARRG